MDPVVQARGQLPASSRGVAGQVMYCHLPQEPGPQALRGAAALSRGYLLPRASGHITMRHTLLQGDQTDDCGKTLPQAGTWLCLQELPLQQRWEKPAPNSGYFDHCSPSTSVRLQLQLLHWAPAHFFPPPLFFF